MAPYSEKSKIAHSHWIQYCVGTNYWSEESTEFNSKLLGLKSGYIFTLAFQLPQKWARDVPKSIRSVILFDLTAGWRRNVLYFMNVKRRKGKKKKRHWRLRGRSGVPGECWLKSESILNIHWQTHRPLVRLSLVYYTTTLANVQLGILAVWVEQTHHQTGTSDVHFSSDHRISLACYS